MLCGYEGYAGYDGAGYDAIDATRPQQRARTSEASN